MSIYGHIVLKDVVYDQLCLSFMNSESKKGRHVQSQERNNASKFLRANGGSQMVVVVKERRGQSGMCYCVLSVIQLESSARQKIITNMRS